MTRSPYPILRLVYIAFFAVLAGCGGGGSGNGNDPPTPPPAPSGLSYPAPQNLLLNSAMTPVRPTVTGTVTSYGVTPALPPGLSLNPTTGEISGTPTQLTASAPYTITASNSSGSTSFALTLTVFTFTVESGSITRIAATGTSLHAPVVVRPVHLEVGALYARAQEVTRRGLSCRWWRFPRTATAASR